MQFTLNRNDTLSTKSGHTIEFVKGKPTHVPKVAEREALAFGASPVDGEVEFNDKPTNDVLVDPVARAEVITAVMQGMFEKNDSEDFTATGYPKVAAVKNQVGFDVTSDELKPLWEQIVEANKPQQ